MKSHQPPTPPRPSSQLTCSVCGKKFFLDETDAPPFCGSRCKMIDLNRWFSEEIGLPHQGGPTKGEATDFDETDPDGLL